MDVSSVQGSSSDALISLLASGVPTPAADQTPDQVAQGQRAHGHHRHHATSADDTSSDQAPSPWLGNDEDGQVLDTYA
jgi:hypothetical protein